MRIRRRTAHMPRPSSQMHISDYVIERVSGLAGRPVPRKAALAWAEVMVGLVAVSVVAIIIRLTVS